MKANRDTEYVFISTRVKAMERGLLSRERMERMLDAPTNEAAAKVLVECGYPDLPSVTSQTLEEALVQRQRETMADLDDNLPDRTVLEIFKVQFDYHNAKVLVKAEALGTQQDRLLLEDETALRGVNPVKRERLVKAGADAIVGDFTCLDALKQWLGL